jgi:phosphoenolpyruvate-protein kinase (PTS system EI component)
VAERLLPSDTVFLSRRSAVAVVVQYGGPACHAALLAKEMGIPTVAQFPDNLFQLVAAGDNMLVDGFSGSVLVKPDSRTQGQFQRRIGYHQGIASKARETCHAPALTRDGVTIDVMANIGCRDDTELAVENGADGIGLYRIETLYLSCKVLPSEDELLDAMRTTLAPARGMPITIRLLDVGGDKHPSALNLPVEDNPFLGRRGVRLLFDYPDLLYTQLRALLRLSREHDIRILIPMVTLTDEVKQIRHMLARETTRLGIARMPPVGAMIETPAAALSVRDIVRYADFLSIGTNDLTQYTMAAGRENPLVSDYFLDSHPAVLRQLGIALEDAGNVPISLCGQLAGHSQVLPKLLELGLRSLSVTPLQVAFIKEALRDCSLTAKPSPLGVSRA